MKNYLFIVAALAAGITLTSCGSSKESAYRKAYEKAKAQEQSQQPAVAEQQTVETPVVTPLQEAPANNQETAQQGTVVRQEKVSVIAGNGLKAYSVIVGSFGVRANAEGLMNTLKKAGYDSQVAYNQEKNMYRVVIATFDTREAAVQSKQSVIGNYSGAWLLLKQ